MSLVVWSCPHCQRSFRIQDSATEPDMCRDCESNLRLRRRDWREAYVEATTTEQRTKLPRLPIVTTDNYIARGVEVAEYLPAISTRRAYGLNALKDIAASFTDMFGGRSGTIEKAMAAIEEEILEEVSDKARELSADAVVGFQIQFGEFSGVSGVMLFATARGTPVQTRRAVQ